MPQYATNAKDTIERLEAGEERMPYPTEYDYNTGHCGSYLKA